MRTRVYVANMDTEARRVGLKDLLGGYVEGATITEGEGLWREVWEPSTIVEVVGVMSMHWVNWIALYAKALGEDSVMVTVEDNEGIIPYLVYEDTGGTVRWERI